MYKVVEFSNDHSIGIVHAEWLTPKKRHCLWPPYKVSSRYNKSLTEGEMPNDSWDVYPIHRTFYSTDELSIARQKLRQAETESELLSDFEETGKRKRRRAERFSPSDSDSEDQTPRNIIKHYPRPPTVNDSDDVPSPETGSVGEESPLNTEREAESLTSPVASPSSPGLVAIARYLAKLDKKLDEILQHQLESKSPTVVVPRRICVADTLKLPCDSYDEVMKIEEFLKDDGDDVTDFEHWLSLVGGKKVEHIVRRMLERLFTNRIAAEYNWTGKNSKYPLKDLKLIKVIYRAVRRNHKTLDVTDDEINTICSNWFRFTKDRDGGREARRKKEA
ncbi:uncharacterized protein LOC124170856 isoform X2 [Ischnura elegans]|nr:uncharacterized protein LOC124170856 isoform X2 [Ischnura elegans]